MNAQTENPYEPRREGVTTTQQGQYPPDSNRRHLIAFLLAAGGAPIGAVLCSIGYLGIVLLLETAFVPPLHSPANYGQFGFLLIYFGFFGLFYGATFGLLPYTRFLLWVPAFLLITYFAMSGEIATHFDATEVTCAAMIIVGIVIVALAAATSAVLQWTGKRKIAAIEL